MPQYVNYPLTPFQKSAWMDWQSGGNCCPDVTPVLIDILMKLDMQLLQNTLCSDSLEYIKKGVHNVSKPQDDGGLFEMSPTLQADDSPYKLFR